MFIEVGLGVNTITRTLSDDGSEFLRTVKFGKRYYITSMDAGDRVELLKRTIADQKNDKDMRARLNALIYAQEDDHHWDEIDWCSLDYYITISEKEELSML